MPNQGPVVIAYDGSDSARRAITEAGGVLSHGPAAVLSVWDSVRAVVYDPLPGQTKAKDVVGELDQRAAQRAKELAEQGADLARAAGFDAKPIVRSVALGTEREENRIWRTIVECAGELDARAIVVGSRARSGIKTALLGSVSHGVIAHAGRPVLVVAERQQ